MQMGKQQGCQPQQALKTLVIHHPLPGLVWRQANSVCRHLNFACRQYIAACRHRGFASRQNDCVWKQNGSVGRQGGKVGRQNIFVCRHNLFVRRQKVRVGRPVGRVWRQYLRLDQVGSGLNPFRLELALFDFGAGCLVLIHDSCYCFRHGVASDSSPR